MPQLLHLPRPIVRTTTRFQASPTDRKLGKKGQLFAPAQLFAHLHLAVGVHAMDLKTTFRDIESDPYTLPK